MKFLPQIFGSETSECVDNFFNTLSGIRSIVKILCLLDSRHRQKTSNSPELLEFMKYGPFLIFWWIFCRNPWKIGYENEVCFEACRLPNFLTVLRFFEKIMKSFQICHNFPLVYTIRFQKSNMS